MMNSTNRLKGAREETGATFVMGTDPMGNALILIPEEIARADVLFNHTLYDMTTMRQVRAVPGVVEVIEEWMGDSWEEGVDPWEDLYGSPRDSLPDDFVLNPSEPFNADGNYPDLIIAPERTQQFAPKEILEEFGTDEWLGGWPNDAAVSRWLPPDQADAIAKRLQELGCKIKHDQELINGYVNVG